MTNSIVKRRKIEFDGDHTSHSLMIGNFGDVEFIAKGIFDLSGMIYSKQTVEFTVIGSGHIRFHGFCRKLIIHLVKGECILDFSALTSREVCCVSLRDKSRTMVGPTKVITRANVQDEAVLKYAGKSLLQSYSIVGKGRIEAAAC
ncbi:MAG TPA: hypothetical protein VEB86_18170 [Chryseosolibacter sp.]|nr:hypothetical protein [Chryseosolibacter sp.]